MNQNQISPFSFLCAAVLVLLISSCTSSTREEVNYESEDAGALVESELQGLDQNGSADPSMAGFDEFVSPDVALGETPPADSAGPVASSSSADTGSTPSTSGDWFWGSDSSSSSNTPADPVTNNPLTPSETVATNLGPDNSFGADLGGAKPSAATKPAAPVQISKVEEVPFRRGGVLLNAAYITRPGDTFNKISERIYGSREKVRELRRANPSLTNIRGGEIVYYNSPQRPEDESQLKTYFEEMGLTPEVYIAKEGDNLRRVSRNLLGHARAWREIYATNRGLDSTQSLAAGTQILYWPKLPEVISSEPVSRPSLAATSLSVPETSSNQGIGEFPVTEDVAVSSTGPQPMGVPQPMEQSFPSDFPTDDNFAMGSVEPPQPPADLNFPPPPPAQQVQSPNQNSIPNQASFDSGVLGLSNDELVTFGGAGVLILTGVVLLAIVRKRRRQKELEAAFGDGAANI